MIGLGECCDFVRCEREPALIAGVQAMSWLAKFQDVEWSAQTLQTIMSMRIMRIRIMKREKKLLELEFSRYHEHAGLILCN